MSEGVGHMIPCLECRQRPVRTGRYFCSPQCAEARIERELKSDHDYFCHGCDVWVGGDDACAHVEAGDDYYDPADE